MINNEEEEIKETTGTNNTNNMMIEEIVEAEIQIRTMAMDFWASLEHKIRYKFDGEIPEEVEQELFNCSNEVKDLDSKMFLLNELMKKYK